MNRFAATLSGSIALLLFARAPVAGAADVEGVWSFSGGEVAVRATAPATTRASCVRRPGSRSASTRWASRYGATWPTRRRHLHRPAPVVLQPGRRRLELPAHEPRRDDLPGRPADRRRALAARVLPAARRARRAGDHCADSAVVAPLPKASNAQILSLVGTASASAGARSGIHLNNPAHDPLAKANITLQGRQHQGPAGNQVAGRHRPARQAARRLCRRRQRRRPSSAARSSSAGRSGPACRSGAADSDTRLPRL